VKLCNGPRQLEEAEWLVRELIILCTMPRIFPVAFPLTVDPAGAVHSRAIGAMAVENDCAGYAISFRREFAAHALGGGPEGATESCSGATRTFHFYAWFGCS
jgi:hypothetical protein